MERLESVGDLRVDGRETLMITYKNSDPSADWTAESGFLVAVNGPDRVWYLLMFCPADETAEYYLIYKSVVDSVRIEQTRSQPEALSLVSVEPSTTLIRQTVEVPSGQEVTYNLSLSGGSTFVATFQVSGGLNDKIDIWLLDLPNYQRYRAGQQYSYFRGTSGTIKTVARYAFQIPRTGIYYLILSNGKAWFLPRTVTLNVYAVLAQPTAENVAMRNALAQSYESLRKLFVFQDFRIWYRHCGAENAYSNPNVLFCMELAESLNEKALAPAVLFVLFHEFGHSLMRLWDLPFYENEDDADQFATMFMILTKQDSSALAAAQWWASQASEQEALSKLWRDDRHSVSPQRARNIIRWLNQKDELLRRWGRVFVPNMQTAVLAGIAQNGDPFLDMRQVQDELKKRDYTPR